MSGAWQALGAIAPGTLVDTRLQIHWAVQLLAGFGEGFVDHEADYRHRAMVWQPDPGAGTGGRMMNALPADSGHRLGLDFGTFRYQLIDAGDAVVTQMDAIGLTLAAAHDWARHVVAAVGLDPGRLVALPTDGLPTAPPGNGDRFDGGSPSARAELARWFTDADRVLMDVTSVGPEYDPVLVWPHHCDMATLRVVGNPPGLERIRSVGVGLSPGDAADPAPYFYVTPWPVSEEPVLPDLPAGYWHTEGWVGAVLGADTVVADGRPSRQERITREFLAAAIKAALTLIGEKAE